MAEINERIKNIFPNFKTMWHMFGESHIKTDEMCFTVKRHNFPHLKQTRNEN